MSIIFRVIANIKSIIGKVVTVNFHLAGEFRHRAENGIHQSFVSTVTKKIGLVIFHGLNTNELSGQSQTFFIFSFSILFCADKD